MNTICVGAGGIGSFLAYHLDNLIEIKQIKDIKFTFFDDDIVELKNILYQNFKAKDIDSYKTDALSMRYFNINFERKRIGLEEIKDTNLVILCADNNEIRLQAWDNWLKNKIPFIDSRANGRAIGLFSSNTKDYEKTLSTDMKPSSCQNPFQLAKKEIEYGNVVISSILAQAILTYSRTKQLPLDFTTML